jgi:Cu-Zn family superoxide dismutase
MQPHKEHNVKPRKLTIFGLGLTALVATAAWPAGAGEGNSAVVGVGPDFVNTAVTSNPLASAVVTVRSGDLGDGNQQITLDVSGIDAPAGTRLGAHVHEDECGDTASASGNHFANPDGGVPLEQREVWLDFTVTANGAGHSVATRDWAVSEFSNRSVVIHVVHTDRETGLASARLACTDIGVD